MTQEKSKFSLEAGSGEQSSHSNLRNLSWMPLSSIRNTTKSPMSESPGVSPHPPVSEVVKLKAAATSSKCVPQESSSAVEKHSPPKGHSGSTNEDFEKEKYQAEQREREDFRQKLEKHGVLEVITKGLIKLEIQRETAEVEDPKSFLKEVMSSPEFNPLLYEYNVLLAEYEEAKALNCQRKIEVQLLDNEVAQLTNLLARRK